MCLRFGALDRCEPHRRCHILRRSAFRWPMYLCIGGALLYARYATAKTADWRPPICLATLVMIRFYIVRYDVFSHQLCYRRASCCGSLSPLPPSDAVVIPRDVETTSNGNGVTRSYGMVMAIEKSRTKHTSKPPQKFPATVKTVVIVGSAVQGNYFSDSK